LLTVHIKHVHDGGTHLTLSVDGKLVCDSVATYGTAGETGGMAMSGMTGGMTGGSHTGGGQGSSSSGKAEEHITSMSVCFDDKLGVKELKKGQKWNLKAYYDYDKYVNILHFKLSQTIGHANRALSGVQECCLPMGSNRMLWESQLVSA
jgi:hypothetical protein